jgi:DNA-binding transcriptional MerR regulator
MSETSVMAIGELALLTGTKVNTIRFYETEGLLPIPLRTGAGRRLYCLADIHRLSFIRKSRDLGFSLDTVRELLSLADDADQSCEAVDRIARAQLTAIDQKIADLAALRKELDRMVGSCQHGTVADCKIIEALAPKRTARMP